MEAPVEPENVFQALKEKIIWLELRPESVLNLSELAKAFNVSRTPIKEALILLQAEEWVLRQGPYFIVTPLSLERIKDITEIRSVLEVQANIWAMYRITEPELATLRDLKKEFKELDRAPIDKKLLEIDMRFHRTLFDATKNVHLALYLERLLCHYVRYWVSIPREIKAMPPVADSLAIIKAFEDKNEASLRAASIAHIRWSMDEILSTF